MRLLLDEYSPYEVQEIVRVDLDSEIYGEELRETRMDIDDYGDFPDHLQAKFYYPDGKYISCYYEINNSRDRYKEAVEDFNKMLERMTVTGYCKQSDFQNCEWE